MPTESGLVAIAVLAGRSFVVSMIISPLDCYKQIICSVIVADSGKKRPAAREGLPYCRLGEVLGLIIVGELPFFVLGIVSIFECHPDRLDSVGQDVRHGQGLRVRECIRCQV